VKTVVTIIRMILGVILLLYAFVKFAGIQFPKLEIYDAVNTLDPVLLVFYFYGYSQPYAFFCAVCELVVGLLVIIPKTSRFGLLCYFAFTLNIAVLDWCFSFALPAKLLATALCLISFLLIAIDHKKMLRIVATN
jgi:hypothetical protein